MPKEKKSKKVSRKDLVLDIQALTDLCNRRTNRILTLEERIDDLQNQFRVLKLQKNDVYKERNQLVAALSKVFPSCLNRHIGQDDWRNVVIVKLSTGQVSWHIHDSELPMFAHLKQEMWTYDGHTTEEKYERLAKLPTVAWPSRKESSSLPSNPAGM